MYGVVGAGDAGDAALALQAGSGIEGQQNAAGDERAEEEDIRTRQLLRGAIAGVHGGRGWGLVSLLRQGILHRTQMSPFSPSRISKL